MAAKLSVNVWIPGLNTSENFLVPSDMNISDVTAMVMKILSDEYPNAVQENRAHMLLQRSSGKALNSRCSLKQLQIMNGEELILM